MVSESRGGRESWAQRRGVQLELAYWASRSKVGGGRESRPGETAN